MLWVSFLTQRTAGVTTDSMRIPLIWRVAAQWLLLAGFLALAGCTPSGPRALLQGERLIKEGKYEQAIARLRLATERIPDNARAWNYLGLAYHGAQQPQKALQAYQRALELDRNLAATRYNIGCLLLEQGNPSAAVSELTTFTLLQPQSPEGWFKLGQANFQARQLQTAENNLNQALKLQPHNPEALNSLGLIQLQRSRLREAMVYFNSALQQQSNYAPAILNQAITLHQYYRNKPLALQRYRDYLSLQPQPANWLAVQEVVQGLEAELRPPAAFPSPKPQVAESSPPSKLPGTEAPPPSPSPAPVSNQVAQVVPPPRTNLPPPSTTATNLSPRQEEKTAETPPPQIAKIDQPPPKVEPPVRKADPPPVKTNGLASPAKTTNQAETRRETKLPPAISVAKRQETTPAPTTNQVRVATPPVTRPPEPVGPATYPPLDYPPGTPRYAYANSSPPPRGNRVEAHRLFSQAVELQQDNRWTEALQYYRRSVEADPSFFEAHYNLGLAAYKAGQWPEALAQFERALAIDPTSFLARYNFGLALLAANYTRDAVREFERLSSLEPKDYRVHLLLANTYAQQLNQPQLARLHYQKVLELEPNHPEATAIRSWLASNR